MGPHVAVRMSAILMVCPADAVNVSAPRTTSTTESPACRKKAVRALPMKPSAPVTIIRLKVNVGSGSAFAVDYRFDNRAITIEADFPGQMTGVITHRGNAHLLQCCRIVCQFDQLCA